jgi:hypothetical protein
LDTVQDTLTLSGDLVDGVSDTLTTVDASAVNLAETIDETRPLITQVGDITSGDVPDGIEAVQDTIPNLAEVAGTIDDTLSALSDFRLDQRVLGVPIRFDLGIRYDPAVPFDESIRQIGTSLDGLPEQLRGLDVYLDVTDENLATISRNTLTLAEDLGQINERVAEVQPLLDEYARAVDDAHESVDGARANLTAQVNGINRGVLLVFVWLGLAQAAPLYLGIELLRGKELTDEDKLVRREPALPEEGADVSEAPAPADQEAASEVGAVARSAAEGLAADEVPADLTLPERPEGDGR